MIFEANRQFLVQDGDAEQIKQDRCDVISSTNGSSINRSTEANNCSKVAKDIDKLENLIQLFLYKDILPSGFFDEDDFENFKNSLLEMKTQYIKGLADEFIEWATLNAGKLLPWFEQFRKKDLLEKEEYLIRRNVED